MLQYGSIVRYFIFLFLNHSPRGVNQSTQIKLCEVDIVRKRSHWAAHLKY